MRIGKPTYFVVFGCGAVEYLEYLVFAEMEHWSSSG